VSTFKWHSSAEIAAIGKAQRTPGPAGGERAAAILLA
jgi:hypothetical protein